jgi:4-hydroxy-tetrahydrodipicolinate synthase
MMSVGAVGMMNAVGNILPEKVSALANAVESGDLRDARALHFSLFEISQAIFYDTNPIPLKYMMRRSGIIERNEHRLPMAPANPALEARLDGTLRRAGLVGEE